MIAIFPSRSKCKFKHDRKRQNNTFVPSAVTLGNGRDGCPVRLDHAY